MEISDFKVFGTGIACIIDRRKLFCTREVERMFSPPGEERETVRIQGLITPMEWDSQGNVVALSLSTFNEEEYPLCPGEKNRDLMSMVRQPVEIHGRILDEEGRRRIQVIDFVPLNTPPQEVS